MSDELTDRFLSLLSSHSAPARACVFVCVCRHGCRDKAASEIKALNLEKENLTVELALTREKARKYKHGHRKGCPKS